LNFGPIFRLAGHLQEQIFEPISQPIHGKFLSALIIVDSTIPWYNRKMKWIYLSPHLDDVVLSVGGLIWEQVRAGDSAEIWTITAGDPPPPPYTPFAEELHARWGAAGADAPAVRRAEDLEACRRLGAGARHCPLPDCIYRRLPDGQPLIGERDDLFRPYPPAEDARSQEIAAWVAAALPADAQLVSPMTLGGHVDHQLVRAAAESLRPAVWYYADYPYAVDDPLHHGDLRGQTSQYHPALQQEISPAGLTAWQDAVAAYTSQISTFWGSLAEMRARISGYANEGGGKVLWKTP
jgi:LmbE family N-acetylglucosaminyl deacetylase